MRTNFNMEYQNITMIRGDTLAFNVEILDDNGDVVLVDSAEMICKKKPLEDDAIFHKTLGDGIQQSDGLLTVRVAPSDTSEADAGRYFYDFRVGIDEDVYTLMIGILTIEQDV